MTNYPQTNTGLIARYTDLTNFSGDSQWQSVSAPMLLASPPSPLPALAPTSGGSDAGGVREAMPIVDGAGTWWCMYGAGDGNYPSPDAGTPWRPQLASSSNRGLTWTKYGPTSFGITAGPGETATVLARDMGWLEKRGITWYCHPLVAEALTVGEIPAQPYVGDIWSQVDAGAGPVGTWTKLATVANSYPMDSAGNYDDLANYPSCQILYNGTYYNFTGTYQNNGGTNISGIAMQTSTTVTGPYTKTGLLLPVSENIDENPDVFYHPGLGSWIMLCNGQANRYAGVTTINTLRVNGSGNPSTGWSTAPRYIHQSTNQLNGPTALGMSRVIRTPDNGVMIDKNNYQNVPILFDAYPTGPNGAVATGYDMHRRRKIMFGQLEPSQNALRMNSIPVYLNDKFHYVPGNQIVGAGGWTSLDTPNAGAFVVSTDGNYRLSLGTTADNSAIYNSNTNAANSRIQVQFTAPSSLASTVGLGQILLRVQNPGSSTYSFYLLYVAVLTTGNLVFDMFKTTNGHAGVTEITGATGANGATQSGNAWQTGAGAIVVNGVYNIFFQVNGTTLSAGLGGVTYMNATDSTITGAGYAGIRTSGTAGLWTNFQVTGIPDVNTYEVAGAQALTDFTAEYAVTFSDNELVSAGVSSYAAFGFRMQGTAKNANGYFISLNGGGGLAFVNRSGGTYLALQPSQGTQVTTSGYTNYIRIKVQGEHVQAWLNGELQIDLIDSTYASGIGVSLIASGPQVDVRNISIRQSDNVLITGVNPKDVVTLRGAGGIPWQTITVPAGGNSASFTSIHYPLTSISVNPLGAGVDADIVAPLNGIWGGDSYVGTSQITVTTTTVADISDSLLPGTLGGSNTSVTLKKDALVVLNGIQFRYRQGDITTVPYSIYQILQQSGAV